MGRQAAPRPRCRASTRSPRTPTRHAPGTAGPRVAKAPKEHQRGARGPWRDDRGSTGVEFVILLPVIVMVLLAGPQLAMGYLAKEAAMSAAQAGARASTVTGAPTGAGTAAAQDFLARGGTSTLTSTLTNTHVTEIDTASTVTLRITGAVPDVIPLPGYHPTVDISVSEPLEQFRTRP